MKNKLIRKITTKLHRMSKCLIANLLIIVLAVSLLACSKKIQPVNIEREPLSETFKVASDTTALALHQYIYARLKTEEFVTTDLESLTPDALIKMVDDLTETWDLSYRLSTEAEKMVDKAILTEDAYSMTQGGDIQNSDYNNISKMMDVKLSSMMVYASDEHKKFDPQNWAENLTKQYDNFKGGQTIKQLANQLGTDAKSAYEQLVIAQEIIYNGVTKDAEFWDKMTKAAQATKSACKVGLFVTATVATGGGTLSSLAVSSASLGTSGAIIVGGADCIVDVATTGSSIILGENHQVTAKFEDLKNKLGTISAVVGLGTFNPGETGEQLAYIGDTMSDWFFENKILGIKLDIDKSGKTNVKVQPINIDGISETEINKEIENANFIVPKDTNETLAELIGEYQIDKEDINLAFEILIEKMKESVGNYDTEVLDTEISDTKTTDTEVVDQGQSSNSSAEDLLEDIDISGYYEGNALTTEAKNSTLGESTPINLQVVRNNDSTVTLIGEDGDEFVGTYNKETQEYLYDSGGEESLTMYLKFYINGDYVAAKGNITSNQDQEGWTQIVVLEINKIK